MPIEKNQVVLFHYSVSDEQGNFIESSRGGEPNAYLCMAMVALSEAWRKPWKVATPAIRSASP